MFPDLAFHFSDLLVYSPAILRASFVLTTSRHGEYFLPCVFCWIYGDQKDFVRVFPTVRIGSSVIVHFNDVDREYLWVWIIGWDEVVVYVCGQSRG